MRAAFSRRWDAPSARTLEALSLLVRSTSAGRWYRLRLTLSDDGKLDAVALTPSEPPAVLDLHYQWRDLAALLTQVRRDFDLPALAAAWVRGGTLQERAAVGLRSVADSATPIHLDDAFHIGSVTKAMTATLIGLLIADGVLDWRTPLTTALPDIDMNPGYRDVTLEDVLQHSAGLPQHLRFDEPTYLRLSRLPGNAVEQRAAYLREVLQQPPAGREFRYSNAGYALAGHIAERATGQPWEVMLREHLFAAIYLYPEVDLAVAVQTNAGGRSASAASKVVEAILERIGANGSP